MSKKMVDRSVVKTQHSATLTPRRFSDPPGGYKNKDRFDTKTRLLNGLTLAFFFFRNGRVQEHEHVVFTY